jgi:integrase
VPGSTTLGRSVACPGLDSTPCTHSGQERISIERPARHRVQFEPRRGCVRFAGGSVLVSAGEAARGVSAPRRLRWRLSRFEARPWQTRRAHESRRALRDGWCPWLLDRPANRCELVAICVEGIAAGSIDARYRTLVLVASCGGLRSGELFALRRSRVDLLRARVDVAETSSRYAGTTTSATQDPGRPAFRATPAPLSTRWPSTSPASRPASSSFPAPEGGPVRASLFRRPRMGASRRAGRARTATTHDLRHTPVALWIAAGATPKEIAARAGHTSASVVLDRYGHLLPGTEERVTDVLLAMARAASARPRDAEIRPLR